MLNFWNISIELYEHRRYFVLYELVQTVGSQFIELYEHRRYFVLYELVQTVGSNFSV